MAKGKIKRKAKHQIPTTRISVVVIDGDKILLVRHCKNNRQYWVLPGGRLEYGETFQECAVREVKEETGLIVEAQNFLFLSEAIAPDRSRHIVNIYLRAKVVGGTMRLGNDRVLCDVDFIPLTEVNQLTLFPPIGHIIAGPLPRSGNKSIEYLGNLWV